MRDLSLSSKSTLSLFMGIMIIAAAAFGFKNTQSAYVDYVKIIDSVTDSLNALHEWKEEMFGLRDDVIAPTPAQKAKIVRKEIPTNDLQCMAENIYYEANNQSYAGKIAVGQVVLNRAGMRGYPSSICGVIYEGSQSEHTSACQFSWTCAEHPTINKRSAGWVQSVKAAKELLTKKDSLVDISEGATNYHADYVSPGWSKKLKFVTQIDQHLFYRASY